MSIPGIFLSYFRVFKQTLQFLQQIFVKKCPSSIWCWDSNPLPLERESLPVTTRPGQKSNLTFIVRAQRSVYCLVIAVDS